VVGYTLAGKEEPQTARWTHGPHVSSVSGQPGVTGVVCVDAQGLCLKGTSVWLLMRRMLCASAR
jgi:hypothetical protein